MGVGITDEELDAFLEESYEDIYYDEITDFDDIDFGFDGDYEDVDKSDEKIKEKSQDEKSDDSYQNTARKIVNISASQLKSQNKTKTKMQKILLKFFSALLILQFIAIIVILLLKGFSVNLFNLSDTVILAFITSVFVETLGIVAIMVKNSFNHTQETEIISILNSYISNFKIYNSSEHGQNDE